MLVVDKLKEEHLAHLQEKFEGTADIPFIYKVGHKKLCFVKLSIGKEGFIERSRLRSPHKVKTSVERLKHTGKYSSFYLNKEYKYLQQYLDAIADEAPVVENLPSRSVFTDDKYYYGDLIISKDGYRKTLYNYFGDNIQIRIDDDREYWKELTRLYGDYPVLAIPVILGLSIPVIEKSMGVAPPVIYLKQDLISYDLVVENMLGRAYGLDSCYQMATGSKVDHIHGYMDTFRNLPLYVRDWGDEKKMYVAMEEQLTEGKGESVNLFIFEYFRPKHANKKGEHLIYLDTGMHSESSLWEIEHAIEDDLCKAGYGVIVEVAQSYLKYGVSKLRSEIVQSTNKIAKDAKVSKHHACAIAMIETCGKILEKEGILRFDTSKASDYLLNVSKKAK